MNYSASQARQSIPTFSTVSLNHNVNIVVCSFPNGHQYLPEFMMSKKRELLLSSKFKLAEDVFLLLGQQHLLLQSRVYVKESWSLIMGDT